MKTSFYIVLVIVSSLFISCSNKKESELNSEKQHCLPGYILFNYVGITDKIKPFTLIRTSEKDSTFFSSNYRSEIGFVGDDLFLEIYCKNYIVDTKKFSQIKEYIVSHNTQKKNELKNIDNYSALMIVLVDQCDSVEYIVNNGDKDYFSNMISTLKIEEKSSLRESLDYYENIIENEENPEKDN